MKARTTISIIAMLMLLIPTASAAYTLLNNGTIRIDHGSLLIDGLTLDNYIISVVGVGGGNFDQSLNTTDAVTFVTVDTGQGANELYDMNQNVLTTSSVTFGNATISDTLTLGGVPIDDWTDIGLGGGVGSFSALPFDHVIYYNGTHYISVNQDGSNNTNTNFGTLFNTIESSDDWIYFASGTYTVTVGLDLNSGGVHMTSSGYQSCKFDASGLGDHMITITSGSNIIEGIEMDGNNIEFNGVYLNGDYEDNQIIQCSIHDFDDDGVYMLGSVETNSNKIIDSKIKDNGDTANDYQIYLGDAIGHYVVRGCTLSDGGYNTSSIKGIYVGYGGQGVIRDNFLWGFHTAIKLYSSENHIIGPDNTITGCGKGIDVAGSNYDVLISGNLFWSNNYDGGGEYSAIDDQYSDIHVSASSNGGFCITGNVGDGASHTRSFLYVEDNNLSTSLVSDNVLRNYDSTEIQEGGGTVTVTDNI